MPRFKRYKVAGQGLSEETEELIYKKNRILRNYLAWSWASQEPLLFMKRPRWSLAILIRKSDSTVLPCFLNQYIKLFNLKVTCYDLQPALCLFFWVRALTDSAVLYLSHPPNADLWASCLTQKNLTFSHSYSPNCFFLPFSFRMWGLKGHSQRPMNSLRRDLRSHLEKKVMKLLSRMWCDFS